MLHERTGSKCFEDEDTHNEHITAKMLDHCHTQTNSDRARDDEDGDGRHILLHRVVVCKELETQGECQAHLSRS